MRNILVVAAAAAAALTVLLPLRWFGWVSNEAVGIGFTIGLAVAVVMVASSRSRRSGG